MTATKTVQAKRLPSATFVYEGKLAVAKQDGPLVSIQFADGSAIEVRSTARVTYSPEVPVGPVCKKNADHGSMRNTLKSTYCVTCDRELQVAYLAKKAAGQPTGIVAARKAENEARVNFLCARVLPDVEVSTRNALLGAARSGDLLRSGSDEARSAWSAARYTVTAAELGITVEQANEITGLTVVATGWDLYRSLRATTVVEVED